MKFCLFNFQFPKKEQKGKIKKVEKKISLT